MSRLEEVRVLARNLMNEHGLEDWEFDWSNRVANFGDCSFHRRRIRLSRKMAAIRDIDATRNTILHEIAHALTPGHKHDRVWKLKAIEVGADPRATSEMPPDAAQCLPWHYCLCLKSNGAIYDLRFKRPARSAFTRIGATYLKGKPETKGTLALLRHDEYILTYGSILDMKEGHDA